MTTYIYQIIPATPCEKSRCFEIKQSIKDQPLTKHPETGEPIRRAVLGGFGALSSKGGKQSSESSCGCAPGGGCN